MATIISLVVGGLIVGLLARLAIPGPDPMPIWTTILLGVGGAIAAAILATQDDEDFLFGGTPVVISPSR